MSFIISKKSKRNGQEIRLYYLVKNYRDSNKIKRSTLLALNSFKTVNDFLVFNQQRYIKLNNELIKHINELDNYVKTGRTSSPFPPTQYTGRHLMRYVDECKAELDKCQADIEKTKRFL